MLFYNWGNGKIWPIPNFGQCLQLLIDSVWEILHLQILTQPEHFQSTNVSESKNELVEVLKPV